LAGIKRHHEIDRCQRMTFSTVRLRQTHRNGTGGLFAESNVKKRRWLSLGKSQSLRAVKRPGLIHVPGGGAGALAPDGSILTIHIEGSSCEVGNLVEGFKRRVKLVKGLASSFAPDSSPV